MKRKKKNGAVPVIRSRGVVLTPLSPDELREKRNKDEAPGRAYIEHVLAALENEPDKPFWNTLWEISSRRGSIGYLRFDGAPKEGSANLEIALTREDGERDAAIALRAVARKAFAADRHLYLIEAWLNRHLGAVRILEKAGFERAFESEGLVRYEKKRWHISFLAFFFILFILLGVIVGYFVGNYPLCVAVGVCLAVLPGALLDKAATKRQEKAVQAMRKNSK